MYRFYFLNINSNLFLLFFFFLKRKSLNKDKLNVFITLIKRKIISNIFFLPPSSKNSCCIVACWIYWIQVNHPLHTLLTVPNVGYNLLLHESLQPISIKLTYHNDQKTAQIWYFKCKLCDVNIT